MSCTEIQLSSTCTYFLPILNWYGVWLRSGRSGDRGSIPGRGERIFPLDSLSRPALGPTLHHIHWVPGVLSPGLKCGRDVTLTTHPRLVPKSRMSTSYISSPLGGCMVYFTLCMAYSWGAWTLLFFTCKANQSSQKCLNNLYMEQVFQTFAYTQQAYRVRTSLPIAIINNEKRD
jgi:hypothetical protein